MKIDIKDFQVFEGSNVKLKKWLTLVDPFYKDRDHYADLQAAETEKISDQQELLYASNCYSLLLIFQAMDSAGKDGAIRHVMSGVNPQGCQVYSFKHPCAEELEHDFLWRTNRCLPERGRIGIFNRSYYEEVLIARVHPEILRAQNLPKESMNAKIWAERFESINSMEKHLHRNGTRVIKFFLHLSKEEQRKRFLSRIDTPSKNWKMTRSDIQERKFWNQYMKAYEACLRATSTATAPWYVVPADDKKNTRLIISRVISKTLQDLKMSFPNSSKTKRAELKTLRKLLAKKS